jgi:hypothetical protein
VYTFFYTLSETLKVNVSLSNTIIVVNTSTSESLNNLSANMVFIYMLKFQLCLALRDYKMHLNFLIECHKVCL